MEEISFVVSHIHPTCLGSFDVLLSGWSSEALVEDQGAQEEALKGAIIAVQWYRDVGIAPEQCSDPPGGSMGQKKSYTARRRRSHAPRNRQCDMIPVADAGQ